MLKMLETVLFRAFMNRDYQGTHKYIIVCTVLQLLQNHTCGAASEEASEAQLIQNTVASLLSGVVEAIT